MATATPSIQFQATLLKPKDKGEGKGKAWTFFRLPQDESQKLPSRGMVPVKGGLNGEPFLVALQPDGEGGHWMEVSDELRKGAKARVGELVSVTMEVTKEDIEPNVPDDFMVALAAAPEKAQATWKGITSGARRDWVLWMTSGKKAETRSLRIAKACDMLAHGKKRICCFDRSGKFDKSLSCPVADE